MKKILMIGIVFLLATSLWADVTYETQGLNEKEYIEISMDQLFKTCEENLVSASLKYNGKTLLISQIKLDSIGLNPWYESPISEYGNYKYQLRYDGYMSLVVYPLNSEVTNIASLSTGDNNVTVQGECLISNNYEVTIINARIITDNGNANLKNLYDIESICSTEELKSEVCINHYGSYVTLGFPLEYLISDEFADNLLEINNSNNFLKHISISLLEPGTLVFERTVGDSNLSLTIKFIEDGALLSSATASDFNIFNSNNEQDIATVFGLLFCLDDDLYNVMLQV